jgi:hypothetical protein
MSIQKKSLISSLNATKKAIVASTPAAEVETPKAAKTEVKLASKRFASKRFASKRFASKRFASKVG